MEYKDHLPSVSRASSCIIFHLEILELLAKPIPLSLEIWPLVICNALTYTDYGHFSAILRKNWWGDKITQNHPKQRNFFLHAHTTQLCWSRHLHFSLSFSEAGRNSCLPLWWHQRSKAKHQLDWVQKGQCCCFFLLLLPQWPFFWPACRSTWRADSISNKNILLKCFHRVWGIWATMMGTRQRRKWSGAGEEGCLPVWALQRGMGG